MAGHAMTSESGKGRLRRPRILVVVGSLLGAFIQGALLFVAAGRVDLWRA